jgi:hypothetical protein
MHDMYGPLAPRRGWFLDEVREYINLDSRTLSDLARDWSAMSHRERGQFYSAIASETCRRQIPCPRRFTDGVVRLIEEQAARDADAYSITAGPVSVAGRDPLAVLLLAIGGAAIWVGARHADRVLAASVGGR